MCPKEVDPNMMFHRLYVNSLDCYVEFAYGLCVVRATKNDNVLQFFNDVVQLYEWLEERMTPEEIDDLVPKAMELLQIVEKSSDEVLN